MNDPDHWMYQFVGNALYDDTGLGVSILPKFSRQSCKDLFISIKFRGQSMTWKDFPADKSLEEDFASIGPNYYPTDFGACCLFVPHVDFEGFEPTINITFGEYYHALKANALNGEGNGLRLLFIIFIPSIFQSIFC